LHGTKGWSLLVHENIITCIGLTVPVVNGYGECFPVPIPVYRLGEKKYSIYIPIKKDFSILIL
jgi:hypothetical protein